MDEGKTLQVPMVMQRTEAFERAQPGADDRVPIALSSEGPVERWFGTEILDHGPGAVDMKRLRARGLPLLDAHDTRQQIGRVEDIALEQDRVLRGMVRFSKGVRAQEIHQDVLDGIRTDVSVGYRVDEYLVNNKDEEYRATHWTPLECSFVAVPADETVGVGRSADRAADHQRTVPVREARSMEPTTTATPAGAPAAAAPAVQVRSSKAETDRAAEITGLCVRYGAADKAEEYIRSELSTDQVARKLLEQRATTPATAMVPIPGPVSPKEKREFSVRQMILDVATGRERKGLHWEISEELSKALGIETRGGFIPTTLDVIPPEQRATLQVGTNSLGGHLRFTEPGSFIDILRNRMFCVQMGAQVISGLVGNVAFPRLITSGTAYWESELGTVTQSNPTLDQVSVSPKRITASVPYGLQLLRQAVVDVEQMIRADIAALHARKWDLGAINGAGSNNEPTGILNVSGIGSVTMGTNGAVPTYDALVDLESEIAVDNADVGSLAYMTTPGIRGKLKKTQQFSGTNGVPIWTGGREGELNGYGAKATTQVPSNLTKGTSTTVCHAIIYGNWNELLLPEWGAIEIIVDPYTGARYATYQVTTHQFVDVAVRHAESFAAIKDALTS
jgi:HK97 family phage major capsid protein